MQDARRHAVDLQHVEIAIGVERIARVVGGDGDRDAARLHLVQQRHAAPARRRAVLAAVLQVEIAHRQRHDGEAGLRHLVQRCQHVQVRLPRQRAAMADQDPALETVPDSRLGDLLQRDRGDVVGLVGVEIEVEPVARWPAAKTRSSSSSRSGTM